MAKSETNSGGRKSQIIGFTTLFSCEKDAR